MKCVLYARVSTEKQADKELSIPAQLQAMREYARVHDWTIVGEFIEPGASARTAERPILQRLLSHVRDADPKIDSVLVHKIDRLARNVYDHATIKALLQQNGVRLASVVENVDESVSGELIENIMASIAQFYSANLSEEVKKGMRQKVLGGGWPHLAPCGYVQVRNADGRSSHLEVHPRLGPLVSKAFDLYATGLYSMRNLAVQLAKEGWTSRTGGAIAQSHMRKILTNPFYMGRIRWKDLEVAGQHQALTSEDVFAKVQQLIASRYRQNGTKGSLRGFPLRGLAICASCRGHMTAERHERWLYYRCSRQVYRRERCPAKFCNAERAHSSLKRICLQIQITRTTAAAIMKDVKNLLANRAAGTARLEDETSRQNRELCGWEMQLTETFATGGMSPETYAAKSQAALAERQRLESHLKMLRSNPKDTVGKVERILQLATSVWDLYEPLNDSQRSELLRIVFATITLGPGGVVGFSLTPLFKAIVVPEGGIQESAEKLVGLVDAA